MNDHRLNDPRLQSFEARLMAMVPQVSPDKQHRLFYECAFSAGQRSASRSLRRWQVAAVALVLLLVGVSVPLAYDQLLMARHTPEPFTGADGAPSPLPPQTDPAVVVRNPAAVELGAWQVRVSDGASLAEQLAQLEKTEPHLRSLAVGTLTRAVIEP